MKTKGALGFLAVGTAAGLAGEKIMAPVMERLQSLRSSESKEREKNVSPGPPLQLAVAMGERLFHVHLEESQKKIASSGLHYGVAIAGGLAYLGLRNTTNLSPSAAGAAAGLGVWLVLDEIANPILGLTAPPWKYPVTTHSNAFVSHLVYGLTIAAVAESLRWPVDSVKGFSRHFQREKAFARSQLDGISAIDGRKWNRCS